MKRKISIFVIALFFIAPITGFAQYDYNSPEFQRIVSKLHMQGHSDHDVATCSVKQLYYEEVLSMLNKEGMSEEDIIQYYVDEYGQTALKEPEFGKSGLFAWVMPVVGLAAGAVLIGLWMRKGKTKAKSVHESEGKWQSEVNREMTEKLFDEERYKRF